MFAIKTGLKLKLDTRPPIVRNKTQCYLDGADVIDVS